MAIRIPLVRRLVDVRRLLDAAATAFTVLTCIAVCWLVFLELQDRRDRAAGSKGGLAVGSVISLPPELNVPSSDVTVLLGLSSTCRFCAESMPAFHGLHDYAMSRGAGRVGLAVLSLEPQATISRYVADNGLTGFKLISIGPAAEAAAVANRTPSVVLVDRSGKVLASWTGRLTLQDMDAVIKTLNAFVPK